jgi:hypothetical protein
MFVVVGIAACGRPDTPRGGEARSDSTNTTDTAMVAGEWPTDLGPTFVVPSDTENLAVVLYPVAAGAQGAEGARLALVSSSGDTVRRQVRLGLRDSLHCGDATIARLDRATPLSWSIGIQSAAAIPLRTDSMDALNAVDSTLYSAEMARLASAVNAQQASRFTGLPFTLATLRRFRIGSREVVMAQVVRRVNQEADPREERTMIVAERDMAAADRFTAVHSGRSDGNEDNTDHFDLLAALRTARGTLLVLARERPTGTTFDILERDSAGAWTVKWSRPIAC